MKAELERIVYQDEILKDMKERWNVNKSKILSALKKSKVKQVHGILELSDDCVTEDEKGWFAFLKNILHSNIPSSVLPMMAQIIANDDTNRSILNYCHYCQ